MQNVQPFTRRRLLGASALGSAGLVLAACGQVQTTGAPMEQDAEAPKEEAEQPQFVERAPVIALLISQREDTIAKTAATLELFDTEHPEVNIAWKLGYPPRELPPLVAAGSPPDVCWWGVAPHQVADMVKDHRPILAAHGVDISEIVEPVIKGNTWQGKLLGVPYGLNTTSIFYNKDHFAAAGLNPPTDETTWEQVLNDADALTAHLNQGQEKKTAWGIAMSSYIPQYLPFVYGGMLDEDGELAADREIVLHMVQMIKDAWTRREAAPGPNNEDIDLSRFAIAAFGRQQLSQVIFGTWGIVPTRDAAEFGFDSIEPPYLQIGGGRTRGAFMGQEEHFVLESSTNPDAETLVVWFAKSTHQEWMGQRGHAIPVHIPSQHSFGPPEDNPHPANQLSFARSAGYATPFWPHPAYRNFTGALNTHLRPHFREEDNLTSEEAVENAFAALEQAIADWKAENA